MPPHKNRNNYTGRFRARRRSPAAIDEHLRQLIVAEAKNTWISLHPDAAPAEIERALLEITRRYSI